LFLNSLNFVNNNNIILWHHYLDNPYCSSNKNIFGMKKLFLKTKSIPLNRKFKEIIKPPKESLLKWRYVHIPKNEQKPKLQVGVYFLGESIIPPNPIIFIHDFEGSHFKYSGILREMNYPYGAIIYNLRGF
jgi:hypothetical protein